MQEKLRRQSPKTRTAHQSKNDMWPRCVPCRHKTINAENITLSVKKLFKKKKKNLSYSLDRPNYGRPWNRGAVDGSENIFVHPRGMIDKDDTGISQAQEELPDKD